MVGAADELVSRQLLARYDAMYDSNRYWVHCFVGSGYEEGEITSAREELTDLNAADVFTWSDPVTVAMHPPNLDSVSFVHHSPYLRPV